MYCSYTHTHTVLNLKNEDSWETTNFKNCITTTFCHVIETKSWSSEIDQTSKGSDLSLLLKTYVRNSEKQNIESTFWKLIKIIFCNLQDNIPQTPLVRSLSPGARQNTKSWGNFFIKWSIIFWRVSGTLSSAVHESFVSGIVKGLIPSASYN